MYPTNGPHIPLHWPSFFLGFGGGMSFMFFGILVLEAFMRSQP